MATVVENDEVTTEKVDTERRDMEVDAIIKNHMIASIGFGVVPVPIIDLIGLTATQLNMLRKLSKLYGQDFKEDIAKKSIASLLGGGLTLPITMGLSSLIKSLPLVGQTAGVIALSTTGAATTYAIGRVFVKHFESGGDFLSFSSKDAKEDFKEELDKGKESATNLKKDGKVA